MDAKLCWEMTWNFRAFCHNPQGPIPFVIFPIDLGVLYILKKIQAFVMWVPFFFCLPFHIWLHIKLYNFFIRVYSLYRGVFIVTNRIGLYYTLVRWLVRCLSPLNPLPAPLKAIVRGFFVLFHIGIWSPSPSPSSPSFTVRPPTRTLHTYTVLI
jgi:hypothetical protein